MRDMISGGEEVKEDNEQRGRKGAGCRENGNDYHGTNGESIKKKEDKEVSPLSLSFLFSQ